MKTGDIVFLRRPYKGYRAVELMERLECRWLVRIVESGLELEVYEDELISEFCKRLSKYIFYSSFSLLTFATKK